MKEITFKIFHSMPQNALSFYTPLPGRTRVSGCEVSDAYFDKGLNAVVDSQGDVFDELLLDKLSVYLMNHYEHLSDCCQYQRAALAISCAYARNLKNKQLDRGVRMRMQRLNFCLRSVIDKNESTVASFVIPVQMNTWDWLKANGHELYIHSGHKGLTVISSQGETRFECGLASQLDFIDEKQISIGSIFTEGAYIYKQGNLEYIPHGLPIVLVGWCEDQMFFLDYRGNLHIEGECTLTLQGITEVSKARFINGVLYVFDWTQPHCLHRVDLQKKTNDKIILKDIVLGNDILLFDNCYYILDKQQGSVYKYSKQFNLESKRLKFGFSGGDLFDPISIRIYEDKLYVLSWLNPALVCLDRF